MFGLYMGKILDCPGEELDPDLHELIGRKQEIVGTGELPAGVIRELSEEIQDLAAGLRRRVQQMQAGKH